MKKIVFLGLVLLLVASSTGFSQNIPLPKDIVIKTPSPGLSKEVVAFSGKWKGVWSGWGAGFVMIVAEIDSEKAKILYTTTEKVYEKITAKVIIGENPKIEFDRIVRIPGISPFSNWYTFEMQNDLKTLKGTCQVPMNSSKSVAPGTYKATLQKME